RQRARVGRRQQGQGDEEERGGTGELDLEAPDQVVVLAPVQERQGKQGVGTARVPPHPPRRQDEGQGAGGQRQGVDVGGGTEVGAGGRGQGQVNELGDGQ